MSNILPASSELTMEWAPDNVPDGVTVTSIDVVANSLMTVSDVAQGDQAVSFTITTGDVQGIDTIDFTAHLSNGDYETITAMFSIETVYVH